MSLELVKSALSPYGADLDDEGFICKTVKTGLCKLGSTGVRVEFKGKRIRFVASHGLIYSASKNIPGEATIAFVTRYWGWSSTL